MKKGARVRLTEKAAKGLSARYGYTKKVPPRIDWFSRRGTVISLGETGVSVQWDGRLTTERYRWNALEEVEE